MLPEPPGAAFSCSQNLLNILLKVAAYSKNLLKQLFICSQNLLELLSSFLRTS